MPMGRKLLLPNIQTYLKEKLNQHKAKWYYDYISKQRSELRTGINAVVLIGKVWEPAQIIV